MGIRIMQFAAVVLTALALVPGGAHLFALPNKIDLDQDAYFTVQAIYRGWALLGVVLIAAILANLGLAILSRRQARPVAWAAVAAVLLGATLVIFFTWTYPANQATGNWTLAPDGWHALRAQWEYSHAVNAVLTFLALCAVVASSLNWRDQPP